MTTPRTFLHVLPIDLRRGAQTYARSLVDHLNSTSSNGVGDRHLGLTIFRSEEAGSFQPELALGLSPVLRPLRFDPRVPLALHRAISQVQPAAVIAHGGETMKYLLFVRSGDWPLVWYRIGQSDAYRTRWWSHVVHQRSVQRADVVACVSTAVAREAAHAGADEIAVIPNGRDARAFSLPRPDHAGPCRLLYVSALNEGKRPEWFLDAVATLRRSGVSVEASMVGGGPLADVVEQRAREAGVAFLGQRSDVPQLLATHDVLAFPSAGPFEGMPGVLIEAGLAGLPVVTTNVAGASDVVVDGETGFIVDVAGFDAFVDHLGRLAEDPALRQRLGRAARERCARSFTLTASAGLWAALLDELVARQPDLVTATP